jgi:uncharacterized protein DUF4058
MPVRSVKNQYLGINAHLHSLWQAEGGWNNFHNRHIGDLAGLLRQKLLPMGYTATIEESLQIRRVGDSLRQPRADVLISDLERERPARASASTGATLTVADLVEEIDMEKPYRAVAVYERQTGRPVAWIELLSPTNKGEDWDAQTYLSKRWLLLEGGLVFVEMDYLHETPPTFSSLFDYSAHKPEAHPYRIVVLDPRPTIKRGPAEAIEFSADEPVPVVQIPLNGDDRLKFDFGACYRKTFEEMAYGLELVDYSQFPPNFGRYSKADQARIAARMLAVLEAAKGGIDLETGPFPVKSLSLDKALKQIETLKKTLS